LIPPFPSSNPGVPANDFNSLETAPYLLLVLSITGYDADCNSCDTFAAPEDRIVQTAGGSRKRPTARSVPALRGPLHDDRSRLSTRLHGGANAHACVDRCHPGCPTSFSLISNAGAGSKPIRAWRSKPRSAPQDAEAAWDWRPPTMPARLLAQLGRLGARPARVWSRNARRIISAPLGMLAKKLPPCCLRDRLGPRRPAASFSRN
jgi:hypothetical protein